MDAICWGQATIAREPANEHDLYTVAVLENGREGGAAGGSSCVARLCTVKPKVSICCGCRAVLLKGVGLMLGQARFNDVR